ncbi:MAG: hypothetical protein ABJB32_02540, partial [Verrucomicrobiota bacterium]
KRETNYWYDKVHGTMGAGFLAERYTIVGQWGTQIDPPAHFLRGAFVAMRTDWAKRWPDAKAMENKDAKGRSSLKVRVRRETLAKRLPRRV